jgi:flagellar motility protein MotE (MotC chaperone)
LVRAGSIKERSVYVYLPSVEMFTDWKGRAKKSNVPLSQFVMEHVTNSLRQEAGEEGYKPRAELIEELRKKDEANEKLTRELEITKLALERVEGQLRRYRAEPFLDEGFRGKRRYDEKLIEILKKSKPIDSNQLLHQLRISPKETDLVKALSNQLESLQSYGLVQKTHHGWKWVG